MLENASAMSYREGYRLNLYETDDGETEYNNSSQSPLTAGINEVTNTSKERINRIESFLLEEQSDSPAKTNWLKNLLFGGVILIGTGALAAGCYCFYIAGRAGSEGGSEKSVLPKLVSTSTIADDFVRSLSDTRANDRLVVAGSTRISETLRSPYSYYEGIYGNAAVENKVRQLASVTATDNSVSAYVTEKTAPVTSNSKIPEESLTTVRTENDLRVDNKKVINDTYYLLDSAFKKELASFCLSGIYSHVIKSYRADPKRRCELLSEIVNKIHYYREMYTALRDINSRKDELAVEEQTNETLIRRKLTILYFAAETIINKKNTLQFYINAMKDEKNYTSDELSKRDANIMNYFSVHQQIDEC